MPPDDHQKQLELLQSIANSQTAILIRLDKLEQKIDRIEDDHGTTKERQVKIETRHEYLQKELTEFKAKHETDKMNIYENIPRFVREGVKDMKIWVWGGFAVVIVTLIGWINK